MLEKMVCERSRRELSLDVSVDVHILLVVEKSSLESQSRECANTPIFTVFTADFWDCLKINLNASKPSEHLIKQSI